MKRWQKESKEHDSRLKEKDLSHTQELGIKIYEHSLELKRVDDRAETAVKRFNELHAMLLTHASDLPPTILIKLGDKMVFEK